MPHIQCNNFVFLQTPKLRHEKWCVVVSSSPRFEHKSTLFCEMRTPCSYEFDTPEPIIVRAMDISWNCHAKIIQFMFHIFRSCHLLPIPVPFTVTHPPTWVSVSIDSTGICSHWQEQREKLSFANVNTSRGQFPYRALLLALPVSGSQSGMGYKLVGRLAGCTATTITRRERPKTILFM